MLRNFSWAAASFTTTTTRRSVTVLTDDERPLVFYGDKTAASAKTGSSENESRCSPS